MYDSVVTMALSRREGTMFRPFGVPQKIVDVSRWVAHKSRVENPVVFVVGIAADRMSDAELYYLLSLEAQGRIEMSVL